MNEDKHDFLDDSRIEQILRSEEKEILESNIFSDVKLSQEERVSHARNILKSYHKRKGEQIMKANLASAISFIEANRDEMGDKKSLDMLIKAVKKSLNSEEQ